MSVPNSILSLFDTESLPSLGPERRTGCLSSAEVEAGVGDIFEGQRAALVTSAILLWHDHLDASHDISQSIKSADGSFLHGILHRREPDYSNAKYWFNRTGDHPSFPQIARRAAAKGADGLIPVDSWDSFAMVDAVAKVAQNPGTKNYKLLQIVQQIELEVLVEQFCGQACPT